MAKRKKTTVNKSAAIRDYIAANPNAGPTEIYDALTKQGLKVSKGLVGVVKYSKPKPKSGKRPGRPVKAKTVAVARTTKTQSSGDIQASDLIAAKKLVDSLGSIAKTREALELLERLA